MSFDSAARLVGKCELESWSVALRQCTANAKSRHDLDACTDKLSAEDHAQKAEALATMIRFKDELCQCTTSACAQKVSDEMMKWSQDQARVEQKPPKMSEEETKVFSEIGEQMGRCMQKAMSAELPPPATEALPPQPSARPTPSHELPF
jgi:hypothetical protein